jgi:hypothetical protein
MNKFLFNVTYYYWDDFHLQISSLVGGECGHQKARMQTGRIFRLD